MKPALVAALLWLFVPVPGIAGPQGFTLHDTPQSVPELRLVTEDGTRKTLADFHGKVILLNVWATWCPPCVKEMPTLDALQADLGSAKFEVVTLSIDTGGVPAVRKFFDKVGIKHLTLYVDPTALAFTNLRIVGLPTTLLIDGEGREMGRLIGPASWNSPEMETSVKGYAK